MKTWLKGLLAAVLIIPTLALPAGPAAAKSLYVITDQDTYSPPTPVNAYLINTDGTLTPQAQSLIPKITSAIALAVDSASATLFMSVEYSGNLQILDALSLNNLGPVTAPGASDPAGIVMDENKNLLYAIERGTADLNVYQWNRATLTLTPVNGSPFTLATPTNYNPPNGYGIALDTKNNLLYVANYSPYLYVYNTGDWSPAGAPVVTLATVYQGAPLNAISVAFDSTSQLLYTGAGYDNEPLLVQKNLAGGGTEKTVDVSNGQTGFGVMGLGVDNASGDVYVTTGNANNSGGDLVAYNTSLAQIQRISNIGPAPVGLVIPGIGTIEYHNSIPASLLLLLED